MAEAGYDSYDIELQVEVLSMLATIYAQQPPAERQSE